MRTRNKENVVIRDEMGDDKVEVRTAMVYSVRGIMERRNGKYLIGCHDKTLPNSISSDSGG